MREMLELVGGLVPRQPRQARPEDLGNPTGSRAPERKPSRKKKSAPNAQNQPRQKAKFYPFSHLFAGFPIFFLTNKHTPEKRRNFDKIRENAPTRIRNEGKIQLKKIGCSIIKLFPGMGNAQQRLGNEELLNAAQGKLKLLCDFLYISTK